MGEVIKAHRVKEAGKVTIPERPFMENKGKIQGEVNQDKNLCVTCRHKKVCIILDIKPDVIGCREEWEPKKGIGGD